MDYANFPNRLETYPQPICYSEYKPMFFEHAGQMIRLSHIGIGRRMRSSKIRLKKF